MALFLQFQISELAKLFEAGRPKTQQSPTTRQSGKPKTKPRPRNHVCETCGKAFPVPAKLDIHMRSHTGARPYACWLCGQTFNVKGNMQRHLKDMHHVTDTSEKGQWQGGDNTTL